MTPSPTHSSPPLVEDAEPTLDVLRRRLLSHGALALALALWVSGLPLWGTLALVGDGLAVLRGRGRWALSRFVVVFGGVLVAESAGVLVAYILIIARSVGLLDEEGSRRAHYTLQRRWGGALVEGARRIYGFRFEIEGHDLLDGRPVLLFMRHTSVADGVVLLPLVNTARGYRLRYVVKRELLWDPCLDVVGHRIPNVFVRRSGADSSREVARVQALAAGLGRGEGLMLFPEGTRYTPARHQAALERLRREADAEIVARGEALRRSMPPRPGGALAAMRGAPEADVVFCALTGLEGLTRLGDLVRGALIGGALRVRFWRHEAASLPDTDEARYRWLAARWGEIDAWAEAQLAGAPQLVG